MKFTFDTEYNAKTMAVMARALRKTVRRRHSRRSDKRSLQGGTADEFRRFIEAATGKTVQPVA